MELSGGQYQKLALARTFYRRHSALILDEPSSNLDPRAEDQLISMTSSLLSHLVPLLLVTEQLRIPAIFRHQSWNDLCADHP